LQEARDETLQENARAEAALMLAKSEREKLDAAIAEKERFLSAAYHDLQQPLSTIGLYARLAKSKLGDDAGGELGVIENAATDIALMFKGVRDIWEIGRVAPGIEAVDLAAVFDEIERELRERADLKGLAFRVRPPAQAAAWVRSDRTLLKRALSNLVRNAIKYTEHGGVLVGAVSFGSRVRIDVWDTGIGIPLLLQERIFEEYFQIGNAHGGPKQGLGLGLAIVRRIERNLPGHQLRLTSRLRHGSRFSLTLPAVPGYCPATAIPTLGLDDANRLLQGKYIVVIEDDLDNLDGLVRAISETGCIVEGVDGADAARRLFAQRERCPDVLVSDFLLGQGQTGLDAVAALRERFDWAMEVPVLFVTGGLQAQAQLANFQGVYEIHPKPILLDALLAALRRLIKPPV
jgi:CheY-like chemotaxis protein